VLPTSHTGGALLFRHRPTKYTFDSTEVVSGDAPRAPFAAFLSNVEYEVAEVTSGHLVTLTYNLCRSVSISSGVTIENQTSSNLQAALTSLLSSPKLLLDGGLLAFGLSHEYPFNPKANPKATKLSGIWNHLKGIDALVTQACDALKLEASLKVIYSKSNMCWNNVCGFVDGFLPFDDDLEIEEELVEYCREHNAIVGYDALKPAPRDDDSDDGILGVVWVKPPKNYNAFKEQYAQVSDGYDKFKRRGKKDLAWAYGMVCLVVHIKPANERD
ncbi:hypothetical protein BJ912DRAFT_853260, partial [Pholiota molesta]